MKRNLTSDGRLGLVSIVFSIFLAGCSPVRVFSLLDHAGNPLRGTTPALHTTANQVVKLAFVCRDTTGDGHELRIVRLDGKQWSAPLRAPLSGKALFLNPTDPLVLSTRRRQPERVMVAYHQKSGRMPYDYDTYLMQSDNGGRHWQAPFTTYDKPFSAQYGFFDLCPLPDDRMLAVWIDNRAAIRPTPSGRPAFNPDGFPALRAAIVDTAGGVGPEMMLDERVSPLCVPAIAMTDAGPVVAYRDETEAKIKDICVVRRVGNAWTPPQPVHPDRWQVGWFPTAGPRIVAHGQDVVVAWQTGAADSTEIKVAFSADAGGSFSTPLTIARKPGLSNVQLCRAHDHSFWLSWLEAEGPQYKVQLLKIDPEKTMQPREVLVIDSASKTLATQMSAAAEGLVFAFSTSSDPTDPIGAYFLKPARWKKLKPPGRQPQRKNE